MKKSLFSFRTLVSGAAAMVLVAGLLTACKKNDAVQTHIPSAGLMAFNLAPDKEPIGIALSGNKLSAPLGYTGYNGTYQDIYTGSRDVQAYDFRDSIFAQSTFTFEDSNYYSVFVVGNNGVYKNITVKDEVDSSASGDKAYIRYINAIPDSSAPVVSISAGGTKVNEAPATFTTVSPFTAVTAGDVTIAVSNGKTINATRTVPLEKGRIYTALLIGVPGSTNDLKKVQVRYIQNGAVSAGSGK